MADPVIASIAVDSIFLLLLGLVFRQQNARLTALNNKKVDASSCVEISKAIKERLERGDKDFGCLYENVTAQGKMLARIDERTHIWAKKNGFEPKKRSKTSSS